MCIVQKHSAEIMPSKNSKYKKLKKPFDSGFRDDGYILLVVHI